MKDIRHRKMTYTKEREEDMEQGRIEDNKEKFNLIEKEFSYAFDKDGNWENVEEGQEYFLSKDVKEFIRLLKEKSFGIKGGSENVILVSDLDKLAGRLDENTKIN